MASRVAVVTGLSAEARLVAGDGLWTLVGGGRSAGLRRALDDLDDEIAAVVSFGLAGGLDPRLRTGQVIVATAVTAGGKRWDTAPPLTGRLRTRLPGAVAALIAGVDAPALTPADKQALREATGAAGVDMESHMAAAFAAKRNLPFAALRVVCDPAERGLPPLATIAMRPDGGIALAAILTHLLRRPWQLPALVQAGTDAARAFAALRRCRRLLGPGLGLAQF